MPAAVTTHPPRAHRPRGRPRTLSRERVISTALTIAAEHGLEAASLQEVARRLGVRDTTLYTYVDSKNDLLSGMVEEVFTGDLPLPAEDDPRPPAEQLKAIYRELHRRARTHRELLAVLGRVRVVSTAPLAASERIAVLLGRLGITTVQQALVLMVLGHVMLSSALTGAVASEQVESPSVLDLMEDLGRFEAFAALAAAFDAPMAPDEAFDLLLDFLLDEVVAALAEQSR